MPPYRSLRSAVFSHCNDYGFDASDPPAMRDAPQVTCVIPYHDTGSLGSRVVVALLSSLRHYERNVPGPAKRAQVVVVDDGSRLRPFIAPDDLQDMDVQVVTLPETKGRSHARNTGLRAAHAAGSDVTIFLDSDILVPSDHVTNLVQVMRPPDLAIACGFFLTVHSSARDVLMSSLRMARTEHDWRSRCVYQPSWIGCTADLEFVGRQFSLLAQTRAFRSWSGMVGPWCLANMVLGGCFAVPTEAAVDVGGFAESFDRYGFTETTLIARLIGAGCAVVPVLGSTAVHVESQPAHLAQSERNARFRDAHRRFFGDFLAGPA